MGLFRQEATRKLTSPEQLDTLACVISPLGWLALSAVAMVFLIAALWGVYGRIPTKASGVGIITRSSGISEVTPAASGVLVSLLVGPGDTVHENEVVAEVALPSLQEQIKQLKLELEQLHSKRSEAIRNNQESTRQREENRAQRRKALELSRADNQQRLEWAQRNVKAQEELFQQGLVAAPVVFDARLKLQTVQHAFDSLAEQLQQIDLEAADEKRRQQTDLSDLDRQIAQMELQLETQRQALERQSHVTSPASGRVVEILASAGDFVSSQEPILQVEKETAKSNDLMAILFVPPEDGKKVRPGMRALVDPSTVKVSEYGGIEARVTGVSDRPITSRSVSRLLANPDLGHSMAASGSQFQITVRLVTDAGTFSGFHWASGVGPPMAIGSGTPCQGEIILEEVPPVSYVMPFFRKIMLGQTDELRSQPR